MKTRSLAWLSLACVTLLPSAGTWAATDTWEFRGTLTQGSPLFPVGSSYYMRYYLTDPLPAPAAPGVYFPTMRFMFEAHSWALSMPTSPGVGVLLANDQPLSGGGCFDGLLFSVSGYQASGFPAGARFDGSVSGITLVSTSPGATASPLTDTRFPTTFDLNAYPDRYLMFYYNDSNIVKGTVDSLYINGVLQVPEPSSLGLLVAGGLLLGGIGRVRRTSTSDTR